MPGIAIYARKSTESEDRQVLSIQSQIHELKELCGRQSLPVKEVFTESKSAKLPGRPVFDELFKRTQRREFDAIVCWKLDRLARNPIDGGALIWALDQGQLEKIITPTSTYSNSGSDKFLMQLEFGMAKKYVDDLSDNVKRGMRAKLSTGWMPHLAPFGYKNDKAEKIIVKDPERFHLVRRMWDLMLTGNYTPTEIADIASKSWGLKSRGNRKSPGRCLSRSSVYALFTNPFYYGLIVRSGEKVQGKHPPMITKSEFDRVQRILGRTDRPRPHRHTFTYRGLLKCGHCGASITAEVKTKKLKSSPGYGRYTYYHCSRHKAGIECHEPPISERELERQVSSFLNSISIPKEHASWALRMIDVLEEGEREKDRAAIESMEKRLGTIRRDLSTLLDLRLQGTVNDEQYKEKESALESEQAELQERLDKISNTQISPYMHRLVNLAFGASTTFNNGDPDVKRTVLRVVGSNRTLSSRKLNIQAQKPLSMLAARSVGEVDEFEMLEPAIKSYDSPKEGRAISKSLEWSSRLRAVRNWMLEHPTELDWLEAVHGLNFTKN